MENTPPNGKEKPPAPPAPPHKRTIREDVQIDFSKIRLPGKDPQVDKRLEGLAALKRMLSDTAAVEEFALIAQMKKLQYQSYIDAGFTPEQAIQLCR